MSAEKMVKCEYTGIAFDAITIDPKLTTKLVFSNNIDQKPSVLVGNEESGTFKIQQSISKLVPTPTPILIFGIMYMWVAFPTVS